jgi:DNA-binding NtrC family response regulator
MDDLDVVIAATRAGAFDFITKAADLMQRVVVTVRNALDAWDQAEQVAELSGSLLRRDRFAQLVAQSPQMEEVKAAIDKLAPSRVNVLVTGPSGTGKEVVARAIHASGPRANLPFVAVNCAGIPDTLLDSELFGYERGAFTGAVARKIGKFEAATGGTLFLDEIGDMSLNLQVKLLRVLQDGRFERLGGNQVVQAQARILCATNRDLAAMVRQGTFREDLYYRIAVFSLELPPLSARRGDIPLLVEHFLRQAARDEGKDIRGVSPEVMRLFELHSWPGNVRQLQNVLLRAAVVCDTAQVSLRDLPEAFVDEVRALPRPAQDGQAVTPADLLAPPTASLTDRLDTALRWAFPDDAGIPTVDDLEAAGVRLALERLHDNMAQAAKQLGISRATLYRRIARGGRGET